MELFYYWQFSLDPSIICFALIQGLVVFFVFVIFIMVTGNAPANFLHGLITYGTIHSYILTLSYSAHFVSTQKTGDYSIGKPEENTSVCR